MADEPSEGEPTEGKPEDDDLRAILERLDALNEAIERAIPRRHYGVPFVQEEDEDEPEDRTDPPEGPPD